MTRIMKCLLAVCVLFCLIGTTWSLSESGKRGGLSRSERGALKALFWATDGPNWKTTWDIENDYSDPCHDRWYGLVCDFNGKLVAIRLSNNNLVGFIPDTFGRPALNRLQELDLSSNFLTGFIPDTLTTVISLEALSISHNHFHGPIPASLGKLINLRSLELQGNKFDEINGIPIVPEEVMDLARRGNCRLIY